MQKGGEKLMNVIVDEADSCAKRGVSSLRQKLN
jgi:hypothetical protein